MLGILLAATVAAAAPPPGAHANICLAVRRQKTVTLETIGPDLTRAEKLGELPDAERYHAVWKTAGGCAIDEVWRHGRWVDRWAGPAGPDLRPVGDGR
jgi:hypothetical protein